MEDAGICLQLQPVGLPRLGAAGQEHIPVVHIDALSHFPVYEKQELRVLPIVPLVDLGADVQPEGLPVKGLRNGYIRPEPVMNVRSVPMHGLAVKGFKRDRILIRIFGTEEVPGLIKPVSRFISLLDRELFQLVADIVDPLVKKFDGSHGALPF